MRRAAVLLCAPAELEASRAIRKCAARAFSLDERSARGRCRNPAAPGRASVPHAAQPPHPPPRPAPAPQACSHLLAATLPPAARPSEDLPVTGVDSDALEAVVRFFYEGRLVLTLANAVAVMDAAQRLQVDAVAEAAHGYVRSALGARTAMPLLLDALRYEADDLADECLAAAVRK